MSFREQEIFRDNLLEPSLLIGQSLTVKDGHQSESSSNKERVICTVMASTDAPESFSATSNAVPLFELRLGIPQQLVERAQEVLDCTKRGLPIPSRQQSTGPSPEEQLAVFFTSINDWQSAGDDVIAKFLAMARMGTQ
ncbi:hypothetical protein DD238_004573 [Peronospora effusa]|uniref:Uncharacterized protein n=1 Tax=Peronospora effusa TaxID=542832 RepID=A0A3M6VBJ5_9STRA|nr:hypothetical protein DD238_004573 [Peronospora effusa]